MVWRGAVRLPRRDPNNVISGNYGGQFGALFICDGIIRNNLIVGSQGARVSWCGGTIENNTIVDNTGSGLRWSRGIIRNCIIWGNTGAQLVDSALPTHSCIQDWTGGGQGNIAGEPLFVDPDGPDDNTWTYDDNDYRLSPDSPCVDAGENGDWMWDARDLHGNMRILYGIESRTVDMGAYEYSTGVDTSPPYVSGRHPAPDATHVHISANIAFHVRDHGDGVDETSIVMTVNGLEVTPMITGTPMDYMVTYDPPLDFAYDETVTITVDAADLSSPANVMERVTYSLTTIAEPSPEATWYVDGSVSASGYGTTWGTAFQKIQEGIDAATDGDTVIVAEETYVENIEFKGKNIVLRSTDPTRPTVVENTVIDGNKAGSAVTFEGTEDETCVVFGFTICNGRGREGGGICGGTWGNRTQATIENNIITSSSADYGGGLAYCDGVIWNNTISENSALHMGGGFIWCDGRIEKNTIVRNSADFGGGLHTCGGVMQNNVISENRAEGSSPVGNGGGLGVCPRNTFGARAAHRVARIRALLWDAMREIAPFLMARPHIASSEPIIRTSS